MMKCRFIIAACFMGLVVSSQAPAYVLDGSKWPGGEATFNIDITNNGQATSPSGQSWNEAFQASANAWNAQSDFKFIVDTTNPSHPCAGVGDYPQDGYRNGVAFYTKYCNQVDNTEDDFGSRTLAITITYTFNSAPEEKVETDIFFNSNESWDIYDGPTRSQFDFKRVALHELGHALGLDHEKTNPAIMQPTVGNLYTLQDDDIAGLRALYGNSVTPPAGEPPIKMLIEDPAEGDVKSGFSTFRGWVISKNPLTSLTLYRDGKLFGELEHGGQRLGVAETYPNYPNAANSGFAMNVNFGRLEKGPHQYRLVARDNKGNVLEQRVNFTVERYDNHFVKDDSLVSLKNARLYSPGGNDIYIEGMSHDGKKYDVILRWKKMRQGFEPIKISPTR